MKRLVISMLGLALIVHPACDDSARTGRAPEGGGGQGGAGASPGTAGVALDGSIEGDDTGLRPGENDPGGAAGSGGAAGAGGDTLNGGAMGAGGTGGEAGGAGAGGDDERRDLGLSPVECRQDAECGAGYCRPVPNVEGAASYCVMPVDRPQLACEEPDADPPEGTCCQDRHCRDGARRGHCIVNTAGICGVAPPDEINICRFDQCYRGADCADDEVCIPAGFRGDLFNRCVRATCRITAECDAQPGGQCRILSAGTNCAGEPIFVCTYPEDECRTDRDCLEGWRCVVGDAGISCQEATPDPS